MKSKSLVLFVAGILLMLVLVQGVQAAESYGYVTQWGTYGSGDGQFFNPYGICAVPYSTPSYVYVVDLGNNRVQKFTTEGAYYSKHGSSGSGDDQFTSPTGCAVDSLGNNYIVDAGNSRVQRFGAAGNYYNQWGSAGSGDGQFLNPRGIAEQSPAHNNYVVDSGNNRVQKFNINGDYLSKWGSLGSGDGQFNQPFGIAVDSAGIVYVADTGNNRIQKFTSTGTYVTQWGSSGSGNGEFDSPRGIAVDSAGNVFVVDTGNNRIQKFTSTGTYVTQWGSFGTGNGEFNSPEAIAVDADGNVYVTDLGNNRVQKFELIPITITVDGDQSYFFGETEIKLSGTNTETGTTYIFVVGPNVPAQGAKLNDDPKNSGVTDGNAASFTQAAVTGGTWSLDWQMDEMMADRLDPGTYTIFAVTQPRDKNNLPSNKYLTASIILKRPFITATFDQGNGPIGTVFTINGVRNGAPDPVFFTMTNNSVPVMLGSLPVEGVKPEDFSIVSMTGNGATFGSAPVETDATFSYTWNTNTLNGGSLLPGTKYGFVVSNHPLNIPDQFASPLYADYYTILQVGIDGVHADYTVDKTSGNAPLTVAFTDISTCVPYVIDSWSIDYGDGVTEGFTPGGGTSSHTYASAGTYNPEITACNLEGCDTRSGETITVAAPPATAPTVISITPTGGDNTGSVSITDLAGDNFETGAQVMLTPVNANPVHTGSIENGAGGALMMKPQYVFVSGNYAYVASSDSNALEIVDITNPMAPVHKGSIVDGVGGALLDGPRNVYVSGNYAYVVSAPGNSLEIVDITNPVTPVHIGSIVDGAGGAHLNLPHSVFVSGNYAYVSTSNALEIVDISNPAAPVHTGSILNGAGGAFLWQAWNVYVSGNYAYVASQSSSALEIIDITNPAAPMHTGSILNGAGGALLSSPTSVYVSGNYAYVASTSSNALEIVDITNPAAPVHKGSIVDGDGGALLEDARGVYVSGNYAYVASGSSSALEIVDITNPAAPVHKGSIVGGAGGALLDDPVSVFISGNYAYLVNFIGSSLEIVDIGTVPAPSMAMISDTQITGSIDLTGKAAGLYNVVVTNEDGQFGVLSSGFTVTAPAATGDIRVESDPPGAAVSIDNIPMVLPTNDTFTGFTPGLHTVKITKTGYFDAKRDVTVVSGDTVKTVIKLDSTSALPPQLVGPVNAVLEKKLDYDTTGVEVIANTQIQNAPTVQLYWDQPQHKFTTANCALTAIDEGPDANGVRDESRPITYMCVDTTDNTIIEEWVAYAPSTNYDFVHAVGESQDVGEAWIPHDPDAWEPTCAENCNNYYALLIDGGTDKNQNYRRYWNDIAFMYIALREYGYASDHITVLMSDGSAGAGVQDRCIAVSGTTCTQWDDSPQNLDGIGGNEVISDAKRATVLAQLRTLKTGLTSSQNLFIFTTGHGGGSNDMNSNLKLWNNEQITDAEFFGTLYGTASGETLDTSIPSITVVMEQCQGFGFKDNFIPTGATGNRVIITAANYLEPSYGNLFSNAFTVGLAGHTRYFPTTFDLSADKNSDKRVNTEEAYQYGKLKDTAATAGTEHPQKYVLGAERFMNDCTGTATKKITVTLPTATGIRWAQNSPHEIQWTQDGLTGTVNIYLLKGGVEQSPALATGVPANQGIYQWTINDNQAACTTYKIRVRTSDSVTKGDSGNNFEIYANAGTDTDKGGLKFSTNPIGAQIFLDGSATSSGDTDPPLTVTGLMQGDHRVVVKLSGYYDQSYLVTVTKQTTTTLPTWILDKIETNAQNEPMDWSPYGGMDIMTDPSGAEIWIDKLGDTVGFVDRGAAPALLELPPGDYRVYATKAGYQNSATQPVTVESYSLLRDPVPVYLVLTVREPDWYTFTEFEAPIDMNGVINVANAGKTIPVKWRLSDKDGYVSNAENFDIQIKPVACLAGSPDTIEVYDPGTSSSLIYNGNGNWHYNWKTLKSYAPNCMNLNIRFANGQESPVAKFRFK